MPDEIEWTGGCMCGAVRFQVEGRASWIAICHCASCRQHTGGILNGAAGFSKSAVRFEGKLSAYESSPGVRRYFCACCGTSLAYQNERWAEDIHLFVGTFDEPEMLKPEFHIFAGERLDWLSLSDHLPRYRTTPNAGDLVSE
jgi:hypothetical protein